VELDDRPLADRGLARIDEETARRSLEDRDLSEVAAVRDHRRCHRIRRLGVVTRGVVHDPNIGLLQHRLEPGGLRRLGASAGVCADKGSTTSARRR
jgi:hypothetical protein